MKKMRFYASLLLLITMVFSCSVSFATGVKTQENSSTVKKVQSTIPFTVILNSNTKTPVDTNASSSSAITSLSGIYGTSNIAATRDGDSLIVNWTINCNDLITRVDLLVETSCATVPFSYNTFPYFSQSNQCVIFTGSGRGYKITLIGRIYTINGYANIENYVLVD